MSSINFSADIDECKNGVNNCHLDAECSNSIGSFFCTCHPGYSGDGVTCSGMEVYEAIHYCVSTHIENGVKNSSS